MGPEEVQPTLITERLELKALGSEHAEEMLLHFTNEEVNRFVDFDPAGGLDDIKGIIGWGDGIRKNGAGFLWGVFLNDSFIGQVNFVIRKDANLDDTYHRAEIGFDLTPKYWKNGYMTEAIKAMVDHIFTKTPITRLEVITHMENINAHRLAKRNGFTREGVMREYIIWKG